MAGNNKTVTVKLGLVTCVGRREAARSPLYIVHLEDQSGDDIATIRLTAGEWESWVALGKRVRS